MAKPKSRLQIEQARTRRRANIRRGMRIALYEVKQHLAEQGITLDVPSDFISYTVALAEGNRRDATRADKRDALRETIKAYAKGLRRQREAIAVFVL